MVYGKLDCIDENVFSTNLQGVAVHPYGWILANLAGGHVILPAMPRASHFVSVHNTLAERPAAMHAGIVDGVELSAHIGQGNRLALHLKLSDRSRRDLVRFRCARKCHLVFSLLFPSDSVSSVAFVLNAQAARLISIFHFPFFIFYFLSRLWRLRHHHTAFELFHHLRLQTHFRGP